MASVEQERSRSLWMDEPAVEAPPLDGDATADALVIGAGIAGLVTAYELALTGRAVTVVDRGRLGRGMTARTSAHLSFELDAFYSELEDRRGRDAAKRWYESQSAAVDRIEVICKEEGIACDLARLDGYLVPGRESDVDLLHDELEAARACGFADAAWVDAGQQPWLSTPAIRFPRQARFHPMKFINGIIAALRRRGAQLYANTGIISLDEKGGIITAKTGRGGAIRAKDVIVATNSPFHLKAAIHAKQAPYRTYVIAGKMNAIHRANTGAVTRRLAACTHAGCTVHWNGFEECWDCPCHGSQFSAEGEPLQAPAVSELGKP